MSKKAWVKLSVLVATSTVAVLGIGGCIADQLLQWFVLRGVN